MHNNKGKWKCPVVRFLDYTCSGIILLDGNRMCVLLPPPLPTTKKRSSIANTLI